MMAAVLAGAFCSLSCQRVYPVRTLPTWVRGIYIPMIQNKTTTTGLEETVTRLTQEEFLADGRVDVVPKRSADLQLLAIIKSYDVVIEDTDNDNIPQTQEVRVMTELKLLDPLDDPFKPGEAVANLGIMETSFIYNSDPRSIGVVVEPDVKQFTMAALARQIVNRTITGFPTQIKGAPTSAVLPQAKGVQRDRTGNIFRNKNDNFND